MEAPFRDGGDELDSATLLIHAGVPDAGVPDAGVPDAGVPDAGVPDAGVPDAGVPDAGVPDAGVPHAGVILHAGVIHAGVDETGNALLIHSPVITSKLVHKTTVFTCSYTNGGISYAWRTR